MFFSWYFSPLFPLSSKGSVLLAQGRLTAGLFSSWFGFQKLIQEIMLVRGPLREAWGEGRKEFPQREKTAALTEGGHTGPEITGPQAGLDT